MSNPLPKHARLVWEVTTEGAGTRALKELLWEGWEPFACYLSAGLIIVLRRQVYMRKDSP